MLNNQKCHLGTVETHERICVVSKQYLRKNLRGSDLIAPLSARASEVLQRQPRGVFLKEGASVPMMRRNERPRGVEAEEGPSGSARAGVPKAWVGAQEESEGALRRGRHQGHVALGSPDPELGGVSRAAPGCLRGRGAQRPCCQKTRQQASTHPGIKRPVSHARSVTKAKFPLALLPGWAPGGWQEGARIRVPKPGGHRRLPRLLRLPSALGSQTQGSGAPMTRALSPRLTLPRVSTKLQVGQGRSVRGQAGKAGRPTAATGWTGRAQDGGGLPTEARTGCSRRLWGRRRTGGQGGAGGGVLLPGRGQAILAGC